MDSANQTLLTIKLDRDLLAQIDEGSMGMGQTRSQFVRAALYEWLRQNGADIDPSIKNAPSRIGKGGKPTHRLKNPAEYDPSQSHPLDTGTIEKVSKTPTKSFQPSGRNAPQKGVTPPATPEQEERVRTVATRLAKLAARRVAEERVAREQSASGSAAGGSHPEATPVSTTGKGVAPGDRDRPRVHRELPQSNPVRVRRVA